jgi:hypothetical protein
MIFFENYRIITSRACIVNGILCRTQYRQSVVLAGEFQVLPFVVHVLANRPSPIHRCGSGLFGIICLVTLVTGVYIPHKYPRKVYFLGVFVRKIDIFLGELSTS